MKKVGWFMLLVCCFLFILCANAAVADDFKYEIMNERMYINADPDNDRYEVHFSCEVKNTGSKPFRAWACFELRDSDHRTIEVNGDLSFHVPECLPVPIMPGQTVALGDQRACYLSDWEFSRVNGYKTHLFIDDMTSKYDIYYNHYAILESKMRNPKDGVIDATYTNNSGHTIDKRTDRLYGTLRK